MFKDVDVNEFVLNVTEDGWYQLKLDYFNNRPEVSSSVLAHLRLAKRAKRTLSKRYKNLNEDSRTLSQCPRKGVAVRRPSNDFYFSWLEWLMRTAEEHYGDVFGSEHCDTEEAEEIDRYAAGKHEHFQMAKMGMFAPFRRHSLTKSVENFVHIARNDNVDHIPVERSEVILKAMDLVREIDLSEIPDGSLHLCSSSEAIYGSNIQGLATGLIQLARDEILTRGQAYELSKIYDYPVKGDIMLADALIDLYDNKELTFDIIWNIVTNLKRVQVGGLDLSKQSEPNTVDAKMFKDAKYRTINANDPIVQIAEASAGVPFRSAIKEINASFYNTLQDPDIRWMDIEKSQLEAERLGCTLFPFDYEIHDAHLHAEWMFNLMMRVVAPKFCAEDRPTILLTAICLVYKIIMAPIGNGHFTLEMLVGGLGSGDPWTNIIGTLGTRTVGYVLAIVRPDIFACDKYLGFNNGDDAAYAIKKFAIETYGLEAVIKVANDIVNDLHYFFNDSKLLCIQLPGNTFVNHWEQYAIWYNSTSQSVKRHGSTLRYFGKVYSDEDPGRQGALEGLLDQFSTLNNTIGYVGNQTFSTTTFNLEVLAKWIDNDSILTSYIDKYGIKFFDSLVKDTVEQIKSKMSQEMSDDEKTRKAEEKVLHHLRASGFDKSGLTRVIHDRDFSFLSITKLAGLGSAELRRIADTGKGRMLTYQVNEGKLQWVS